MIFQKLEKKMNHKILQALIREILKEDYGSVTVNKPPKKKSLVSRAWSGYVGLFSADESSADEEILDEDEEDECDE